MIGVSILGAGNIAGAHLKAYLRFDRRCRVHSLCDMYPDKAAALLVDGSEGRATLELITAIYKAAVSRAPVVLPRDVGR